MKGVEKIEPRVCPACGGCYRKPPAISRKDGRTYICPDCGTREALEALGASPEEQERILRLIHGR